MDLIFRNVRIDDTKPLMEVAVHNGKIIEVAPTISAQAEQEIQGHGNVLIPGFVEGHLHLEKANIMHRKANRSGTLKEAIAVTAELKPTLTRDDIFERSTQALRALVQAGTTHVRAHAEFDPVQGFTGFDVVLELRDKLRVRIPRHPATQSALIWPGIPRPSGHLFHGHPAGQSERSDAGGALLV